MIDLRNTDKPQRTTLVIAVICAAYLIVLGMLIQLALGSAALFVGVTDSVFQPFVLSLTLVVLAWAACTVKAFYTLSDVREGAAVVARRLGAVQASTQSGHADEKTLISAVAQNAIAFGCAKPSVFVLRDEASINSFTVGSLSGDTSVVFTNGALQALDEDELVAMGAHEFSHIANIDVPTNMRLMVALSGLLALDQYGRKLLVKSPEDKPFHLFSLFGYALISLGVIGTVFGRVLRAVFTRQREHAADIKAVELLCRTESLSSVLLKINQSTACDVALYNPYVDEIRHVCFHSGNRKNWRKRLNSNHPNINARLKTIDPSFEKNHSRTSFGISKKVVNVKVAETTEISAAANEAAKALGMIDESSKNAPINNRISTTIQDPASCLAVLFSLFFPEEDRAVPGFLSAVAFAYNQNFADKVLHLSEELATEIQMERLNVVQFATDQLKVTLKPNACRRVLLTLERLLKSQGLYDLMNCAAVQHIRQELAADFPVLAKTAGVNQPNAERRLLKPSEKMGEEFSLLLSLVLDATDLDSVIRDNEYARVIVCYPSTGLPRRTAVEPSIVVDAEVVDAESAYQALLMQPLAVREAFVQHCSDIFRLIDKKVRQKGSVLDLFAASLGCAEVLSEHHGYSHYARQVA